MKHRQQRMSTTTLLLVTVVTMTTTSLALDGPIVTTKYGKIQGMYAESAAIFHGVPFASPPVGQLRWKSPVEPTAWGIELYDATLPRPACPQYDCAHNSPPLVCPKQMSEDCLYLDIFIPKRPRAENSTGWPVMVYLHGGNFVSMGAASLLFDGRRLAGTRGVIQVNVNYRLGALGFLVTGESSTDARGNYGILDQQMALKWVTENIRNFGGDPAKVTLFGQSAGAQSTLIHLTLPSSAPYFRNAIIESSPIAIPYKKFPEAIVLGGLLAGLLGCQPRDMECLRSKPAEEIAIAAYQVRSEVSSLKLLEFFEPWGPFVDGDFIKAEPLPLIQAGQFSHKPLVIGTNSEETVLYIYSAWNTTVDEAKYFEVVVATSPTHTLQVLTKYPPAATSTATDASSGSGLGCSSSPDQREVMVKLSTDLVFGCPTRNATRIMRNSTQGLKNIWVYLWDHAFSFQGWGPVTFCEGRVCHGAEIVYLFHTEWAGNFSFTAAEEVLSEEIMDFWSNFAKTGDPNNPGSDRDHGYHDDDHHHHHHHRKTSGTPGKRWPPKSKTVTPKLKWPVYEAAGSWPMFRFRSPASNVEFDYRKDFCNFWDTVGYAA